MTDRTKYLSDFRNSRLKDRKLTRQGMILGFVLAFCTILLYLILVAAQAVIYLLIAVDAIVLALLIFTAISLHKQAKYRKDISAEENERQAKKNG